MSGNPGIVDPRRIRRLNSCEGRVGPVIYWMSRDQRVRHNWALLYACGKANEIGSSLEVVFTLAPSFLGAPWRHYDFMLRGLMEVEASLRAIGIPMAVLSGDPAAELAGHALRIGAGAVVTDFSPLRLPRSWKDKASRQLSCPFYEVDAHNIVPCWLASTKQEFAARTIRPKLNALAGSFLKPYPEPDPRFQPSGIRQTCISWESLASKVDANHSIGPVDHLQPGENAAEKQLRRFIDHALHCYAESGHDPNAGCVSGLSPYLHFGQISAQHAALSALESGAGAQNLEAFVEELFIRRELAENYCYRNERYDAFDGIPGWAKATLAAHADDRREYCYSADAFECAVTHDPLWNAAQSQLVKTGTIHGYMRMYWAKKILEWSDSPAAAFDIAVMLNDRYALDGRDPNGYTGIAWSIGGLHDRPWFERPVYGKIRYMNAAGSARKFDVERYIRSVTSGNAIWPAVNGSDRP
ncbi:MAG: deoxyribodipyrimidine photo-lyase [Chlorobiaceae bacterium]|nr:deoxyribodipyrimidine photo-lyase [Chlorobiaceae bacterium]